MLCMKKELRPIEILLKFSTEATLHRKVHPKLKSRTSVQVWVPEAKKSSQFQNIAFCSFITNTKNTKNMSKRTRNRQNIQLHVWKVAGKQESPSGNKPKTHEKGWLLRVLPWRLERTASGRWDPEEILLYPSTINSTLSRWRRHSRWLIIFWQREGWGNCQLFLQNRKRESEATRWESVGEGRVGFL